MQATPSSKVIKVSDVLRGEITYQNKIKDARSVSLYPYIQSQIWQNVKYTKLTQLKDLHNFVTNNVFMDKK